MRLKILAAPCSDWEDCYAAGTVVAIDAFNVCIECDPRHPSSRGAAQTCPSVHAAEVKALQLIGPLRLGVDFHLELTQ